MALALASAARARRCDGDVAALPVVYVVYVDGDMPDAAVDGVNGTLPWRVRVAMTHRYRFRAMQRGHRHKEGTARRNAGHIVCSQEHTRRIPPE